MVNKYIWLFSVLLVFGCSTHSDLRDREIGDVLQKNYNQSELRIAYFLGGRTSLLYRALLDGYYEKEDLDLSFITKVLNSQSWSIYNKKNALSLVEKNQNGKATGIELIKKMLNNESDMAVVGEAAFVKSCANSESIVGVAQLGADEPGEGGHAIVIRNGVTIKSAKDLEKIVWGTRRSSGGDEIFLKDFLIKEGADISKIKFIVGIDDKKLGEFMKSGKIQGAYYHLKHIMKDKTQNTFYVYRKLNWVNPDLSQAVAVVTREYYNNNKEIIKKFIRAYMKRVAYERGLSIKERLQTFECQLPKRKYKRQFELMEANCLGMNFPQYPRIPTIRRSLSEAAVDLFLRHKFIDKSIDLSKCYDNSLVKEISSEMYPGEKLPD